MDLRRKVTEAMGRVEEQKAYDEKHPYHYKDYRDNLYCPMGEQALQEYGAGSGSETKSYIWRRNGKEAVCPAKMSSIGSSSAMTFNLLGDGPVQIKSSLLPSGSYQVQYEKQMYTLRTGKKPANLDAFLSNENQKRAIFCEMKFLEWLPGKHKELKIRYKSDEAYFDKIHAYPIFEKLIREIEANNFRYYDAWQMFKHLLAIYNYTSFATKNVVERSKMIPSMAGRYKEIVLLNVINEFPQERLDVNARNDYITAAEKLNAEKDTFLNIVNSSGVADLFCKQCHAKFAIRYMTAKEFAQCLDMPAQKRTYLKRYFD